MSGIFRWTTEGWLGSSEPYRERIDLLTKMIIFFNIVLFHINLLLLTMLQDFIPVSKKSLIVLTVQKVFQSCFDVIVRAEIGCSKSFLHVWDQMEVWSVIRRLVITILCILWIISGVADMMGLPGRGIVFMALCVTLCCSPPYGR